jgi:fermentation-respiration switch protein FrsA (DUF1100 family)
MRARYPDGFPLENALLALGFAPEQVVERIAPRAVAFVAYADDTIVPLDETLAMFARAREPKELVVVPEGNHGGALGPQVDATADTVAGILARHVRRPAATGAPSPSPSSPSSTPTVGTAV